MANNQLLASDSFASGSLAAGWLAYFGLLKCQVIGSGPSAVAEANAINTQAGQIWTGLTWPSDHASEVTVSNLRVGAAGPFLLLHVRWQSGAASGYQANITTDPSSNPAITLNKFTAGSAVQLGSTVTSGVTFAAGDVWSFQAAGACLSLYQNGKRIAYFYDATYTSGSPGFSIFDQTGGALTDCQVSSWRGYNAVQQDGIWQKQGIVIPANATDLTPDGALVFGAFQISKILFNGSKYTALFASGVGTNGAGGNGNIYYADSPNGLAPWTRSAGPVIANYTNPSLWFDGTTYHCYCQSISAVGGNIAHFTSPDLTSTSTWTLVSSNVLSPGSGLWDNGIFLLAVVAVIGGTWYGLYTGNASGSSQYKIGLATSADGGATWTKYVSNPVLTAANGGAVVGSQAVKLVGNTYYAWFYGNQPGQGNAVAPLQDPFDAVRYKTTDFKTDWTLDAHSQRHTEQFESLNFNTGGVAPCAIIDIGGKAYMYSIHCPSDAIGPQIYQTGLAIAPASIASIVTQPEDGMPQVASDSFTSGAGDLSPNWSTPTGATKLKIVAGPYAEATALSTSCAMRYTGASFSSDQYSETTIQALSTAAGGGFIIPTVRGQASGLNFYQANIISPTGTKSTAMAIYVNVNGTTTQLGPTIVGCTPQVGDRFRLAVVGNVLTLFQNDFVILQVQDYANTYTSGAPGMYIFEQTSLANAQISKWAGGNANVIPTYSKGELLLLGVGT